MKNPNDFYFSIYKDIEGFTSCGFIIAITLKSLWDLEKIISETDDECFNCIPNGFYELSENEFQYNGTENEARIKLLSAGFIENNDIQSEFPIPILG